MGVTDGTGVSCGPAAAAAVDLAVVAGEVLELMVNLERNEPIIDREDCGREGREGGGVCCEGVATATGGTCELLKLAPGIRIGGKGASAVCC